MFGRGSGESVSPGVCSETGAANAGPTVSPKAGGVVGRGELASYRWRVRGIPLTDTSIFCRFSVTDVSPTSMDVCRNTGVAACPTLANASA